MKKLVAVESKKAPAAIGPYSQAVKWGPWVVCSGQIPLDPQTGELIQGDIIGQTELVMKNIEAVLEAAGSGLDKVIKATIFLKDLGDFNQVNAVYKTFFKPPYPARSCVEVSRLPRDASVEIEVWAHASEI